MSVVSREASNDQLSMKPAFALALDIGTSSVRAALYDHAGNEIINTSVKLERELHATFNGGAEIDGDEAIEQIARVIDDVLAKNSQLASQIEIVAVSCFWHSLVGIDKTGEATTPVYGWADTRSAQMVGELQSSFDEQETHSRTGCRFHSSYWPAKLLWMRQRDANAYRNTVQWMSLSELLMRRLLGKAVVSISMASGTGLFNQRTCTWDEDLLSYLGIETEKLPRLAVDGESFSGLVSEYANRWPQLQKARWFPAIGDGAANNIGAGCATLERVALMIGTSGAMRVLLAGDVPENILAELFCYRADKNRVVVGGALSDGGGLFASIKNSFQFDGGVEEIELGLGEMEPDNHGLTILPFWAGERSTGWHASARGSITGLTSYTRPIEILRAAMEAIAYRFARIAFVLDEIAPGASIVASGGALISSPVWTQIIADVLGRQVTLSDTREASSRGAVLLALEMEGRIRDIEDASVQLARTYEPDMARHVRYKEGLKRQEKLYTRLMN